MLVSDVINFATRGELKQLTVAEVDPEDPNSATNIEILIGYINLGIIELYKRFGLAHQSLKLENVVDGASYTMTDDFLYLSYAIGNNEQESEIPINNEFATFSIFEPAPYQLFITKDVALHSDITEIFITYVATPALLTAETEQVPLQHQFIDPLLLYMAYRGHSSVSALQQEEGNLYFQRYEASVRRILRDGLLTPDNQSNYKLHFKGFR